MHFKIIIKRIIEYIKLNDDDSNDNDDGRAKNNNNGRRNVFQTNLSQQKAHHLLERIQALAGWLAGWFVGWLAGWQKNAVY